MYYHSDTGIKLPDTVGPFQLGQAASYPTSSGQTGVAVPYHAREAEATVFIRPMESNSLESASDLLEENLSLVKRMEADGKYTNVNFYRSDGKEERPGWQRAGFTTKSNNLFRVSLIYCSVQRGHAFKIRVTAPNPTEDVKSFVKAVQELIDSATASS